MANKDDPQNEPSVATEEEPRLRPSLILVDSAAMRAQYQMDMRLMTAAGLGIGFGVMTGMAIYFLVLTRTGALSKFAKNFKK